MDTEYRTMPDLFAGAVYEGFDGDGAPTRMHNTNNVLRYL
jgi:hypothetical protein